MWWRQGWHQVNRKAFEVKDERRGEVMDVEDTVEDLAKSLNIHFANDSVSA